MKSRMLMKTMRCGLALALLALVYVLMPSTTLESAPVQPDVAVAPSAGSNVGATTGDVRTVVVGDLDNDGEMDVVSGDASGYVTVWRNSGEPFGSLWSSNVVGRAGDAIYALALSDPDHDGDLDLVSGAGDRATYELVVWQNDGTPFQGSWTGNSVGGAATVRALAVADLDHDGLPDIISGDASAVIGAWRNDGTPFSGLWATHQIVGNTTAVTYALAAADLDNDGDLDLASGAGAAAAFELMVWQNDGTPFTGAWTSNQAASSRAAINALALADLDGDGKVDIVSDFSYPSDRDYWVAAWQNDGTPWAGSWMSITPILLGSCGDDVYAVTIGDLDNDGNPDVIAGTGASSGNEVMSWLSPTFPFTSAWPSEAVGSSADDVYAVALADLDRDGDLDIVSGSGAAEDYELIAWKNSHALEAFGSWVPGNRPSPILDTLAVDLADFDHDGATDVAAGSDGHGVQVWRGAGGATWSRVGAAALPASGRWRAVAWGQINNRVEVDLAAASTTAGLRAWHASQAGAGWDDRSTGLPTSGGYFAVALGDIDHDGRLDLVAGGDNVGVGLWQGQLASWSYKNTLGSGKSFCDLRLGHINHDGNLDIVAANCGGAVRVWLGDGAWNFSEATAPASSGNYRAVALGDINRDGLADVVAASGTGAISVWAGNGGGSWSGLTSLSSPGGVNALDLADFDNDGYLDLLAAGEVGLQVWRGDGGHAWGDVSTGLPSTGSFHDAEFGRIDGDAALDIVAAETGSTGVRVWTAFEPPPGGWADFQPPTGTWTRAQQITCTVQVADAGSGLDVSTAQYRFSRDGGVTWVGDWLTATVSGSDGTTAPQVMTATNVPFNQDSDTRNVIQFRITDMAGLVGDSPHYALKIDSTPPTNPSDLISPDHTPGAWSSDQSIRITWTDIGHDNLSGIWGYSWRMDQASNTVPDQVPDQGAGPGNLIDLWGIPDGDWYFHLMTRDTAGNWSVPTHLGPYRIDTAEPTTPTLESSSHTVGGWSNDNTIYARWTASDGGGLAGYSFAWDDHLSLSVDPIIDTVNNYTTSGALADDQWYLNVRAVDRAGNAGDIAHFGPFGVDANAPNSCWINAPATCGSSCTIQWRYLDGADASGVASYDVQVRRWDATPTWEDWLRGTTSTSAIYTDTGMFGTYSFQVRARDRAGNLSGYDCSDETLVEDIHADALEITQGIQNLASEVPLIADKTTYVRFHVHSAAVDVTGVNALLYGTRDGVRLPGSPLSPAGGRITVRPGNVVTRANLNHAFYFRLPPEWRSGTIDLRAVVNPSDDAFHAAETDYGNNESTERVPFQTSGNFCMVMVPIHLHPRTYFIDENLSDFWSIVNLMKWMFPVSNGGVGIYDAGEEYPEGHRVGWEYGIPDDFDVILQDLVGVDFWTNDPCHDTHYYGMVHPDSYPGWGTDGMGYRYNYVVGHHAAGVMLVSSNGRWPEPVGGGTMAHELAHNFRRKHVWCTGCEQDGGEVDNSYPYEEAIRHTCGVTTTYTCRIWTDNDETGYYGFWPKPGGPPEIISPVGTGDLMSYFSRKWPSDWTYRALLNELRDLAQTQNAPMTLSAAWAEATEYLYASGLISPTSQTAELSAFYRTSSPDSEFVARSYQQERESTQANDVYSLVLLDAGGNLLYTHTFTVDNMTNQGASMRASFAEVLPYDNRTALIALKQGSATLASRAVSAQAPTVTVLAPNDGEDITDQLLISWVASDADGDALRYVVQYSPDNGATWRALAVDWMDTSFSVDNQNLALLPGSNQARIRVIASDGVNTGEDQSDAVFTIARKAPQAHILEPATGSHIEPGSTVVLMGAATDTEDGPLSMADAITWTSSLSGTLGYGTELWVATLFTGTHHITLTARDSDGNTGTDTITLFVGATPNKVHLPVILKH